MIRILFIVGSMRKSSFNRQLARMAEKMLLGQAEVKYLEFGDVPNMNQDIEFPAPVAVTRVREEVNKADGIWIFSPEYNYSYPGVLKNLLDWLSRPLQPNDYATGTPMTNKPVTISNAAGKSGGSGCRSRLIGLLEVMRTKIMKEPSTGVILSAEAFSTGEIVLSNNDKMKLSLQANAFIKMLSLLK